MIGSNWYINIWSKQPNATIVVGSSKNLYFFLSSFVNLKTSIKNIGLLYSIIASLSADVIK